MEEEYEILLHELQEIKKLLKLREREQAHNEYATVAETAKLLKVTTRTLQNWRDRGLISFVQIGSKILFKAEDVEEFIMNHHISRKGGES